MTLRRPSPLALAALLSLSLAGCGKNDEAPEESGPPEVEAPAEGPIAEADEFIRASKIHRGGPDWKLRLPKPPVFQFPSGKQVYWVLTTNQGRMVARLWHDIAPIHVSSFIYLSRLKFFDGLTFHRVIRGFMAQGGDPIGNGTGTPGYALPLEVRDGVRHDRVGILSTANMGRPNTDGAQFFIMFGPRPMLDGGYSIFGEVVEGLDTLRRIEALGASRDPGRPRERIVIRTARVELR